MNKKPKPRFELVATKTTGGSFIVTIRRGRDRKHSFPAGSSASAKRIACAMIDAHDQDENFNPQNVYNSLGLGG